MFECLYLKSHKLHVDSFLFVLTACFPGQAFLSISPLQISALAIISSCLWLGTGSGAIFSIPLTISELSSYTILRSMVMKCIPFLTCCCSQHNPQPQSCCPSHTALWRLPSCVTMVTDKPSNSSSLHLVCAGLALFKCVFNIVLCSRGVLSCMHSESYFLLLQTAWRHLLVGIVVLHHSSSSVEEKATSTSESVGWKSLNSSFFSFFKEPGILSILIFLQRFEKCLTDQLTLTGDDASDGSTELPQTTLSRSERSHMIIWQSPTPSVPSSALWHGWP